MKSGGVGIGRVDASIRTDRHLSSASPAQGLSPNDEPADCPLVGLGITRNRPVLVRQQGVGDGEVGRERERCVLLLGFELQPDAWSAVIARRSPPSASFSRRIDPLRLHGHPRPDRYGRKARRKPSGNRSGDGFIPELGLAARSIARTAASSTDETSGDPSESENTTGRTLNLGSRLAAPSLEARRIEPGLAVGQIEWSAALPGPASTRSLSATKKATSAIA